MQNDDFHGELTRKVDAAVVTSRQMGELAARAIAGLNGIGIDETIDGHFTYLFEVLRPNWLGRLVALRCDLARLPPGILGFLTSYRGCAVARNIIPTEGRNSILDVAFHGSTQITAWFCFLYENNYTAVAGDTMAAFPAAAGEVTAYTETTRPAWNEAAASSGVTTNAASTATFTFNATKTLYGAGLSSSSVKGGTSGVLASAAKFSASKGVDSGDIGRLTASVTFTSS